MVVFFNLSPTSSHLYPLQVGNCDSNSRLVVDEDDNDKFRIERVNIYLFCFFCVQVAMSLPARAEGYSWALIYSCEKNGFSLKTLYRCMQSKDTPILLLLRDTRQQVNN